MIEVELRKLLAWFLVGVGNVLRVINERIYKICHWCYEEAQRQLRKAIDVVKGENE